MTASCGMEMTMVDDRAGCKFEEFFASHNNKTTTEEQDMETTGESNITNQSAFHPVQFDDKMDDGMEMTCRPFPLIKITEVSNEDVMKHTGEVGMEDTQGVTMEMTCKVRDVRFTQEASNETVGDGNNIINQSTFHLGQSDDKTDEGMEMTCQPSALIKITEVSTEDVTKRTDKVGMEETQGVTMEKTCKVRDVKFNQGASNETMGDGGDLMNQSAFHPGQSIEKMEEGMEITCQPSPLINISKVSIEGVTKQTGAVGMEDTQGVTMEMTCKVRDVRFTQGVSNENVGDGNNIINQSTFHLGQSDDKTDEGMEMTCQPSALIKITEVSTEDVTKRTDKVGMEETQGVTMEKTCKVRDVKFNQGASNETTGDGGDLMNQSAFHPGQSIEKMEEGMEITCQPSPLINISKVSIEGVKKQTGEVGIEETQGLTMDMTCKVRDVKFNHGASNETIGDGNNIINQSTFHLGQSDDKTDEGMEMTCQPSALVKITEVSTDDIIKQTDEVGMKETQGVAKETTCKVRDVKFNQGASSETMRDGNDVMNQYAFHPGQSIKKMDEGMETTCQPSSLNKNKVSAEGVIKRTEEVRMEEIQGVTMDMTCKVRDVKFNQGASNETMGGSKDNMNQSAFFLDDILTRRRRDWK